MFIDCALEEILHLHKVVFIFCIDALTICSALLENVGALMHMTKHDIYRLLDYNICFTVKKSAINRSLKTVILTDFGRVSTVLRLVHSGVSTHNMKLKPGGGELSLSIKIGNKGN